MTSVTTGSPLMSRTPDITPTWMSRSHSLWKIRGGRIIVTTSQSFCHIFEHTSAIVIVVVVVTFGKYIFVSGTAFASTRLARNTCSTGATGIRSPKTKLRFTIGGGIVSTVVIVLVGVVDIVDTIIGPCEEMSLTYF